MNVSLSQNRLACQKTDRMCSQHSEKQHPTRKRWPRQRMSDRGHERHHLAHFLTAGRTECRDWVEEFGPTGSVVASRWRRRRRATSSVKLVWVPSTNLLVDSDPKVPLRRLQAMALVPCHSPFLCNQLQRLDVRCLIRKDSERVRRRHDFAQVPLSVTWCAP